MRVEKKRLIVKTVEELAEAMHVSDRTILRWKKKGMPITEEGYYDLEAVRTWNKKRLGLLPTTESDGEPYWRKMIAKNRARLLEVQVKKLEGKLLSKEEVELREITRIIEAKKVFLALPGIVAPTLAMKAAEKVETILYKAMNEIIDDFARNIINKDEKGSKTS